MATGLIVVTLVIWHPGSDEPPNFLSQARTLRTETFTVRTYYWTSAIEIFKDNPVVGTGLDTYYGQYPIYRQPEDGRQLGLTITDKPHNVFLEYAANSGIVGLGSYLLLVGYGLFLGYKSSRRLDGRARLLAVTFTSVLAGYLAQGFFSIDVPPLAVMGWIGLAGIAALADTAARSARDAALAAATERPGKKKDRQSLRQQRIREREQPARWGIHAPIAVGVAVLLALGIIPWLADVKSKEAQVAALRQEGPDEIERLIEAAASLNPLEPTYRSQAGFHASQRAEGASIPSEKQALLDAAIEHYEAAYRLQSGNLFYILNLARANTQIAESLAVGHFPAADDWWRLGVERDPTDWEIRNSYALFLNTWANAAGDPEIHRLSSEQLSKVVEIKPDLIEAWINLGKVKAILGETSEARRAWEMALMLDPNNQAARDLLS
jgi:tetratricopeptide (TPR) repeat protein